MKYFLHDSSAFDDEKITEVFLKFGYEGLGLFYTALEKMAKQEKPIKTEVLKAQLKVKKKLEKCWCFLEEIGLISSTNGESFNKQLLNFSENYQIKKEKTRKRISEWRKNQEVKKDVTQYKHISNTSKVKLSKVKESKESVTPAHDGNLILDFNEIKDRITGDIFIEKVCQSQGFEIDSFKKFILEWLEKKKICNGLNYRLSALNSFLISDYQKELAKPKQKETLDWS
jgi:hypothetical protein